MRQQQLDFNLNAITSVLSLRLFAPSGTILPPKMSKNSPGTLKFQRFNAGHAVKVNIIKRCTNKHRLSARNSSHYSTFQTTIALNNEHHYHSRRWYQQRFGRRRHWPSADQMKPLYGG
jgi:hypothetical protein